ncbi:putative F-box protein At1g67623 [Impatiens glandulifera]|uniref:putative F-box protein At1g67623 n=1 Tax=Impatiens glandulifera TaxID=253017 RepID=UPI001FB0542D|nr:putative F-box protein At1g67623 [Impatiens glandulifera]
MNTHTHILSIPDELLINVLAFLGASSYSELLKAKTICKTFNQLSQDDYIYERASLQDIDVVPWQKNNEQSIFLKRCTNSHNSEALYRHVVVEYFSGRDYEIGLEYLEKAKKLGHVGALYVFGIISLFGNSELKKNGVEILNHDMLKGRLWKCRGELIEIINKLWTNIPPNMKNVVVCCSIHNDNQKNWKSTWPVNDCDDYVECEACKCDRELDYLMPCIDIRR